MMGERINKFLIKGLWAVLAMFTLLFLILKPISAYDYFGVASEAIGIAVIIMGVYNAILWKYNPLEKAPRLMGQYNGFIEYNFTGILESKPVNVIIKQTALTVTVKIVTDEITSNTITSNLVEENDEYVLYYTYITNPRSRYSEKNPIQHGTCRLIESGDSKLRGTYWTSRKTIGDIELEKQR
jgi:hypothetical protein